MLKLADTVLILIDTYLSGSECFLIGLYGPNGFGRLTPCDWGWAWAILIRYKKLTNSFEIGMCVTLTAFLSTVFLNTYFFCFCFEQPSYFRHFPRHFSLGIFLTRGHKTSLIPMPSNTKHFRFRFTGLVGKKRWREKN